MIRLDQNYLSFIIKEKSFVIKFLPSSIILCFCLDPQTDHPAHTSRAEQPLVTNRRSSESYTGFYRDHFEVHPSRQPGNNQAIPNYQHLPRGVRAQERGGFSADIQTSVSLRDR